MSKVLIKHAISENNDNDTVTPEQKALKMPRGEKYKNAIGYRRKIHDEGKGKQE